jgi:plastocyanin
MHGFRGKARSLRARLCVGAATAAVVLGASVAAEQVVVASASASVKHKAAKKAAKAKHKKKPVTKAAAAPASAACTAVPPTESALGAMLTAFLQHVDAAHLNTSLGDQLASITGDTDNYLLIHTILVENMIAPTETAVGQLGDVVNGLLTPLVQHVNSAHLSTSPADQVQALLGDPDNYLLIHTILVNNMLGPLEALLEQLANGTPGSLCPTAAPAAAPGTPAAAPAAKTVSIANFMFAPATLTVPVGTTVTWKNTDSVAHTITSMGSGPLNSPNIAPGATFSYTFSSPGSFMYVCAIHPNMMGTVVVQ